jgi:hypothetical protein
MGLPCGELQRHRRQWVVLRKAVGKGRVSGWNGAVGQHQTAVEMALRGGRQVAVECLAQQAGLLARPFGGEQGVGQFGGAQQQAPVPPALLTVYMLRRYWPPTS